MYYAILHVLCITSVTVQYCRYCSVLQIMFSTAYTVQYCRYWASTKIIRDIQKAIKWILNLDERPVNKISTSLKLLGTPVINLYFLSLMPAPGLATVSGSQRRNFMSRLLTGNL